MKSKFQLALVMFHQILNSPLSHTLAGPGLEPGSDGSEPSVLPLDDPASQNPLVRAIFYHTTQTPHTRLSASHPLLLDQLLLPASPALWNL